MSEVLLILHVVFGVAYAAVSAHTISETSKPADVAAFRHGGPDGFEALLGCAGLVLGIAFAFVGLVRLTLV